LAVQLKLPKGWKINTLAPMDYFVEATPAAGPVERTKLSKKLVALEKPVTEFEITLPVNGEGDDEIKVSMNYYYCQEGDGGLCKTGSVTWTVPLKVTDKAKAGQLRLTFDEQQ